MLTPLVQSSSIDEATKRRKEEIAAAAAATDRAALEQCVARAQWVQGENARLAGELRQIRHAASGLGSTEAHPDIVAEACATALRKAKQRGRTAISDGAARLLGATGRAPRSAVQAPDKAASRTSPADQAARKRAEKRRGFCDAVRRQSAAPTSAGARAVDGNGLYVLARHPSGASYVETDGTLSYE